MRKFHALPAALVLAFSLNACVTAPGPSLAEQDAEKRRIRIQTFTASEEGGLGNSYLISASSEALLVDVPLTKSEAEKLAKLVKDSKRNLKTIFITRAEPDHYLGLERILKDYPRAKVIATPGVAERMAAKAKEDQAEWKRLLKDQIADKVILPKAFAAEGNYLDLENERIEIREFVLSGSGEPLGALFLSGQAALISGDLLFTGIHPRLGDASPEAWLEQVEAASEWKKCASILPGHGPSGKAGIFEEDRHYLEAYLTATLKPSSVQEAVTKMSAFYPAFQQRKWLEENVQARLQD